MVECYDKDGNLKWIENRKNIIVNTGLDHALETWLAAGTQPTYYVGLKGTGSAVAGDTMASHSGWSELVPYSEGTRPTYSPGSASSQSISNSGTKASFSINGTSTIYGAFLATDSTKSGTSGTLIAAVDFSASRAVINGDTLEVTYTVTAADN